MPKSLFEIGWKINTLKQYSSLRTPDSLTVRFVYRARQGKVQGKSTDSLQAAVIHQVTASLHV